jgi:2-phospho-L-lactate/phosphoenolpyruvate guanylyltransferase
MPKRRRHTLTALIPVKTLAQGKSRLGGLLTPQRRIEITEDVLRRLIHILHAEPAVTQVAVITRDANVSEWLLDRDVRVLQEHGDGLNIALREARAQLDTEALLVLPADLIAVTAEDIRAMIALASAEARVLVLAPDRHGSGTNALLVKPPTLIDFAFGSASFALHQAAAVAAGAACRLYCSDSIALDLDVPEDYELYSGQW